jgi:hypothetical protein
MGSARPHAHSQVDPRGKLADLPDHGSVSMVSEIA